MKRGWKIAVAIVGGCLLCTGAFAAGTWIDNKRKDYTITVGERVEITLEGDAGSTVLPGEELVVTLTPRLAGATANYSVDLVEVAGTCKNVSSCEQDWLIAAPNGNDFGAFVSLGSMVGAPLYMTPTDGAAFSFKIKLDNNAENVAQYSGKTLILSFQLVEKA